MTRSAVKPEANGTLVLIATIVGFYRENDETTNIVPTAITQKMKSMVSEVASISKSLSTQY